jgi:hypothetical protein
VLWRRSEAARWEAARDFGADVREALIAGVSRDDVVFGVQALSADGHSSLAVFAPPVSGR